MKFLDSKTLLTIVATIDSLANAHTTRRDATTCLTDLKQCDAIMVQLKKDVDAYAGQGSQAVTINHDIDKLNKCLQQTQRDCSATDASSVTSAQASSIINYCNSPFEPDLKSFLASLKNKRAAATSNGLKPTVQSQLKQLSGNMKGVTDTIIRITPTSQKTAATSCVAKIHADLSDATAYYT